MAKLTRFEDRSAFIVALTTLLESFNTDGESITNAFTSTPTVRGMFSVPAALDLGFAYRKIETDGGLTEFITQGANRVAINAVCGKARKLLETSEEQDITIVSDPALLADILVPGGSRGSGGRRESVVLPDFLRA